MDGGIENIVRSLEWGGLNIDEGVYLDKQGSIRERGDAGPYIQSKRLEIYTARVTELLEKGSAYHCFCSKERLDELRRMQEINKLAPGYDGHCRDLEPAIREKNLTTGVRFVIRLRVPRDGSTMFTDLVRGPVSFENALIDDQVLMKSDGFPTYHFAVVVDDHFMGTTHVVRGEEWLPSTPKHILLYSAFGWEVPQFAHLSLLVNEQKQKLSKRHGDVAVEDFREKGYIPEAMVNFIALLGWNPGNDRELFTLGELAQEFSFEHVNKAAAVFNREKLDWYNQQHIRALSVGELTRRSLPYLENAGLVQKNNVDSEYLTWLEKAVLLVQERLVKLSDMPELIGFLFVKDLVYEPEILIWKKSTREITKKIIDELTVYLSTFSVQDWNTALLQKAVGEWILSQGYGVGDVLWPFRVALAGQKNSPPPFEIACVLGKEKTIKRLGYARDRL